MKRFKKGFTLIELLIVMAIVGILAAIALPMVGGDTEEKRSSATAEAKAFSNNILHISNESISCKRIGSNRNDFNCVVSGYNSQNAQVIVPLRCNPKTWQRDAGCIMN